MLFKEPVEKGKRANFKNFSFNFDSAAGINYTVEVTKPAGEKITIQSMSDGKMCIRDRFFTMVDIKMVRPLESTISRGNKSRMEK